MRQLGIDTMTVFGLAPVEHISLAADLGCSHISMGLTPVPWKLDRFPLWSLREDAALRRDTAAALRDRNISIALADGFAVRPQTDISDKAADLDLFAALGAQRASAVSMEPDLPRALEQFATLAELTAERGMGLVIEFAPPHPINTLEKALAAIHHIDRANVALVIDAMHVFRSDITVEALAAIDPRLISYIQLCDVPFSPQGDNYLTEACFHRLCPGEGELPLRDLLSALPRNVPVGLEVPMLSEAQSERDFPAAIERCVTAARTLLGEVDA